MAQLLPVQGAELPPPPLLSREVQRKVAVSLRTRGAVFRRRFVAAAPAAAVRLWRLAGRQVACVMMRI
jgi:hypothetical protein